MSAEILGENDHRRATRQRAADQIGESPPRVDDTRNISEIGEAT
jgi:hypothetical protein